MYNNTSGSFTLDVAATGGTGAEISQGGYAWVYCDGTNVELAELGTNASTISTGTLDNARLNSNVVIFESGTSMLFQQSTAPTGWTKQTSHNNKALRVVTGSVSSGGSNSFTDAFNSTKTVSGTTGGSGVTITGSTSGSGVTITGSTAGSTVTITGSTAAHTLTVAQIPSHTHREGGSQEFGTTSSISSGIDRNTGNDSPGRRFLTDATGGGQGHSHGNGTLAGSSHTHAKGTLAGSSHTHGSGTLAGSSHTHSFSDTFNLDVQYVDFIIANKD